MAINYKKSCCLRIRARCDVSCANITSLNGHVLPWTNAIRYLGIHSVQSRTFKCSIDEAKRSFYTAANAIFGKIGRFASEEVTLHLLKTKCVPVILYGVEALPLNKSQISSLDFVINRFFMKLFNTNNIEIVKYCQQEFCFSQSINQSLFAQICNKMTIVVQVHRQQDSKAHNGTNSCPK